MVSVLDSGSSGPGSIPGGGTDTFSASSHPTSKYNAGVNRRKTSIPSREGRVEILLVVSCYGNLDKLRPDEPGAVSSNAGLTFSLHVIT